jgi:hypothetical protein
MIVKGETLNRTILLYLADTGLQKIMDATVYQSKSVSQIIQESNVFKIQSSHRVTNVLAVEMSLVCVLSRGIRSMMVRFVLL